MLTITDKDRKAYRLESQLAAAARERLTKEGAVVIKIHGEGMQQRAVDFIVCYLGRYAALELKVGKNQPSELQEAFLARVAAAGGVSAVAYTVADCLEALQQIEKESRKTSCG